MKADIRQPDGKKTLFIKSIKITGTHKADKPENNQMDQQTKEAALEGNLDLLETVWRSTKSQAWRGITETLLSTKKLAN